MILLPYENITYRSQLEPETIAIRLQQFTEPEKYFRFFWDKSKSYEGVIENSHFKISRIIFYQNSFLPIIRGKVERKMNSTVIEVKMKMKFLVIALIILVWLIGFGIFIKLDSIIILKDELKTFSFLLPAIIFFFAYLLPMIAFKIESRIAKKFLKKQFEAEIGK